MEAAGNDDGDDGDDGGHGRRLRQCNLCKFIGKCLAIFLRFLARHFLLCHNFLPASFCILFVHIWRLLQFIFNFIVCCQPRGKGGEQKEILKQGNNRNVCGRGSGGVTSLWYASYFSAIFSVWACTSAGGRGGAQKTKHKVQKKIPAENPLVVCSACECECNCEWLVSASWVG